MKIRLCALWFICLLATSPAQAATTPDSLALGGGLFDFDKIGNDRRSIDARIDYQWGVSLLPLLSPQFRKADYFLQMHPVVGFEGNSKGMTYPNAGFNLDMPVLWRHMVLTWGETVGLYNRGDDTNHLGYPLEFRSQLELGWRLSNDVRVSAYVSHLSNAYLATINPGAEIVGGYIHIPLHWGK